jgi:hypothetical protein
MMDGDGRIEEAAAQRPQPGQNAFFVDAREPTIADHVSRQNRRQLAGFAHRAGLRRLRLAPSRRGITHSLQ